MPLTFKDQGGKTIKVGQQVRLEGIVSNFLLNEDEDRSIQMEVSYTDGSGTPQTYVLTARPATLKIMR